eukprot:gene5782-6021_t
MEFGSCGQVNSFNSSLSSSDLVALLMNTLPRLQRLKLLGLDLGRERQAGIAAHLLPPAAGSSVPVAAGASKAWLINRPDSRKARGGVHGGVHGWSSNAGAAACSSCAVSAVSAAWQLGGSTPCPHQEAALPSVSQDIIRQLAQRLVCLELSEGLTLRRMSTAAATGGRVMDLVEGVGGTLPEFEYDPGHGEERELLFVRWNGRLQQAIC